MLLNHHLVSCETRLTDFLSATKTLQILTEPYGDKTLSREWHKRFSGGKNGVEDDERAERPKRSSLPYTASLWCNWVRAHDMPAMFRYLDHWATVARKDGCTRVVKLKTKGREIVPPVYNDSL
ncbi:hypothetical protein TNCV_3423531 [Trichonephila clavipes]|nr:hypothetical protein TNCV_3423531 [Trichonephila clavipes]